jgi:hypothetical protein
LQINKKKDYNIPALWGKIKNNGQKEIQAHNKKG